MTGQIAFLYNHDAAHQVAHSAGIAGALAGRSPAQTVVAATAGPLIRAELQKHLSADQIAAIDWLDLSLPSWLASLLAPLNRLLPLERLMRLLWHRRRLRSALAIVSTERTCLLLKRLWRNGDCPRFILVPHGAGDRNVTTHPAYRDFDLFLLSGAKVADQFINAGLAGKAQCRIIGYAKFDGLRGRTPDSFFGNARPTFLYNPHFDPRLSSWYNHGPSVLEWFFRRAGDYNLIFAPHVMLFAKKIHISPEHRITRIRREIDDKYRHAANIRIDTESSRLFDMSYTIAADVYIGDVSSQIYEFLHRPRPCFFIDSHGGSESANTGEYDFWRNGPVVRSVRQLGEALPDFEAVGAAYRAIQIDRMAYTADRTDPRPASVRGASAIADYLAAPDP